jgi:dolichol-phosphate mannosyltransferase
VQSSEAIALEVLLPVHNEAETIEAVIREFYDELSSKIRLRFIICEDGSRDATKEILTRLAQELPLVLMLSHARKGYSRAVRDGMENCEASYLLCVDSDGQCDPRDFWQFWLAREEADIIMGRRVHRSDTRLRRFCSGLFHTLYQAVFHVPVHDPSCPYVLARKEVYHRLVGELGSMAQGFWWEFVARAHRRGLSMKELPIHHRLRAGGVTQVYKYRKMPGIFLRHVAAIFQIWAQTRRGARPQPAPSREG